MTKNQVRDFINDHYKGIVLNSFDKLGNVFRHFFNDINLELINNNSF